MELKKRLQIKWIVFKGWIKNKFERKSKPVPVKKAELPKKTFKERWMGVKIKWIRFKIKFKDFLKLFLIPFIKIKIWGVNLKHHLTDNFINYKHVRGFIIKVLFYGLIIFGLTGAIWGYKWQVYLASVSLYWIYETVILDDIPSTIIYVKNSTRDKNK